MFLNLNSTLKRRSEKNNGQHLIILLANDFFFVNFTNISIQFFEICKCRKMSKIYGKKSAVTKIRKHWLIFLCVIFSLEPEVKIKFFTIYTFFETFKKMKFFQFENLVIINSPTNNYLLLKFTKIFFLEFLIPWWKCVIFLLKPEVSII